jgi:hypothetical protein
VARTLTTPGPLDTLEDAFDLLQQAPASVWLRYLAGAAPLIVGLLFVWNQLSSAAGPSRNPVLVALFLVAVLVWFYRCRQIFSGRLRRILSLTDGAARTSGRASLRGWAAACFEGTKLVVMPIAAISLITAAFATAFYRNLSLYAGEGQSAGEAVAKAWKAARVWQRENWFGLAITLLLCLAVFVDVAVAVIAVPILVKMFTGYESIFTQRGTATLDIEFPIIVALTWISMDPLLEAVYIVRVFRWEGLRSGEDLLVRLKRLAPIIALLLCGSFWHLSAATPSTLTREGLNQSIDQTLTSHDYDWRIPPPATTAEKKDWFLDAVDRVVALVQKGWKAIGDAWKDLRGWINRMLRPIMPSIDKTEAGKPSGVRPIFYGFAVVILALALVLLWKFGPRRKAPVALSVAEGAIDITNEGVLASDLPEHEWLQMADRYLTAGDLRLALRALYLGTLALLNHRGLVTIHACKSNRDYEREVRRRSHDSDLSQIFRLNIRSFEQSWYGFHEVTGDQLQTFRDNLGRMRSNAA